MQILEIPFQQKNIFINGVPGLGFMGNETPFFLIKNFHSEIENNEHFEFLKKKGGTLNFSVGVGLD
jgi:hypothetical protein